jgi:DNA-directed RNA polymerase subunit RPC12/RpoP
MKTDYIYMTYRCKGCTRLITKIQVLAMMTTGTLCPCGSGSITPCNISGTEWLLPRVWKLIWAAYRGQLAPEPESGPVRAA